jgi:hypothetical protein
MKLTFIVTIDPVKDLSLLDVLVHSLNLQTAQTFNVAFYNQTLLDEAEIFSRLSVRPAFDYVFYSIDRSRFFGAYPVWDLYEFHNTLLDAGVVHEYFMALHMEEFFDIDYVEQASRVLKAQQFDIMFGNLSGTQVELETVKPLLSAHTAAEFDRGVERLGLKGSHHWSFDYGRLFGSRRASALARDIFHLYLFKFRRSVAASRKGYRKLRAYMAEDLYFMRRDFAERYNWFLRGHTMRFEDIHICEQEGICELGRELAKITEFPVYFDLRRIYHLTHRKYYFQLVDEEFTSALLCHEEDDPILNALKKAILMYRAGEMSLAEALRYSRRNPERTGTQNMNYAYHMKYLEEAGRRNGVPAPGRSR